MKKLDVKEIVLLPREPMGVRVPKILGEAIRESARKNGQHLGDHIVTVWCEYLNKQVGK